MMKDRKAWRAAVHGVTKSQMQLNNYSEYMGFPGSSVVKNVPASARDTNQIPGSRRSPEEGNGNPLQYSFLGNTMTEEPGGLQSIGLQRVRHNFITKEQKKCIHVNANFPIHPSHLPALGVHTFVLYVCVSISALQKVHLYHFSRLHKWYWEN